MVLKERLKITISVALATIFPRSVLGVLGRVFGALSLLALLQHSLEFGLRITFEIVLDVYLNNIDSQSRTSRIIWGSRISKSANMSAVRT